MTPSALLSSLHPPFMPQCTKHPVLSGCAECSGRDGGDACQKCLPGYLLRAGQCVRCRDPLCIVCSGAKADKCQRCTDHDSDRSGYKPVFMGADGVCKKVSSGSQLTAVARMR